MFGHFVTIDNKINFGDSASVGMSEMPEYPCFNFDCSECLTRSVGGDDGGGVCRGEWPAALAEAPHEAAAAEDAAARLVGRLVRVVQAGVQPEREQRCLINVYRIGSNDRLLRVMTDFLDRLAPAIT